MNKVTPLVVVAVRECMRAGQRSGAGGGGPCPPRSGMPRRPRLCLAPAPRAPAPGTKTRARGLFPSVLGVPRLGARAEGRRPRARRSLGARRLLLRSRSAGGRARGGPRFRWCAWASPSRAKRVPCGRRGPPCPRRRASVAALCPSALGAALGQSRPPLTFGRTRGAGLSPSAATRMVSLGQSSLRSKREAAAGHGLSLEGWAPLVPVGQENARPQWRSQWGRGRKMDLFCKGCWPFGSRGLIVCSGSPGMSWWFI